MFIGYAALKTFGPDARFNTELHWNFVTESNSQAITNVKLVLEGDPSWGLAELFEDEDTRALKIAEQLSFKGITDIYGDVSVELKDSRWNDIKTPQGTLDRHTIQCFGALPSVVTINRNCAILVVNGYNKGYWFHKDVATPVRFEMSYGSSNSVVINRDETGKGYIVKGTWVKGSTSARRYTLPVTDSQHWAKNLL